MEILTKNSVLQAWREGVTKDRIHHRGRVGAEHPPHTAALALCPAGGLPSEVVLEGGRVPGTASPGSAQKVES